MAANRDIGYVLLALGIMILLFTLYQAYMFYSEATAGTLFTTSSPQQAPPTVGGQGNLTQQIESSMISQVLNQVPIQKYAGYIFAVLLLGVLASIGYKFAMLGINELRNETPKTEKQ